MMLYRLLSAPISVQIEITTFCNQSCIHCYNYWRNSEQPINSILSKEQLEHIIQELIENRIFSVTFTGGEPLLFSEQVIGAIKRASENGIFCTLNSNLASLTPEIAKRLRKAGISSILTSLVSYDRITHDFVTQRHGSFSKTLDGIKIALEAEIRLNVNMVVSQFNAHHVYNTGKLVNDLGVKNFSATKASPPLNCKDFSKIGIKDSELRKTLDDLLFLEKNFGMNVDILECYPLCFFGDIKRYQKFAKHNCTAGITTCTIGASGDVRPCSHADLIYGNIFSESLGEIWKKMREWRDGSLLPDLCLNCEYLKLCTGGCRMEAKYYQKINSLDPFAKESENIIPWSSEIIDDSLSSVDLENKEWHVNPFLRSRKEDFGGVLCGGFSNTVFVTSDSLVFIERLRRLDSFRVADIVRYFNISIEEVLKFCRGLIAKGVLLSGS